MLSSFPLQHDDYVHDIAFDFSGKRIATCSSDQKIRVWEKKQKLVGASGGASGNAGMSQSGETSAFGCAQEQYVVEWELVEELSKQNSHSAAVQRVQWADSEFGSILASSSFDKQVFIWEEIETKDVNKQQWVKRINFMEKEAILDIKFAPKHWGLTLAIALADGTIKMQTSKDLSNLTQWSELCVIKLAQGLPGLGCNCLSWNPAFDEPQMFAVGCSITAQQSDPLSSVDHRENLLQIYIKEQMAPGFTLYSAKFPIHPHTSTVNDVAWAPLMGRSFHMIASCSKERVVVWKVTVRDIFQGEAGLYKDPIIEPMLNAEAHRGGEVWRLSWNLLGTCVASSGDDGAVRLWKKSVKSGFTQIACLQANQ
ncbi:hypothetical protein FGO68_gene2251 [Halteria grandinella]|nr:hypothetical protein FGO68_gene2251 [Halteria grandinella]